MNISLNSDCLFLYINFSTDITYVIDRVSHESTYLLFLYDMDTMLNIYSG